MNVLVGFMFGVLLLSVWELRGGPKWRTPVVVATCAVVAFAFMSLRLV